MITLPIVSRIQRKVHISGSAMTLELKFKFIYTPKQSDLGPYCLQYSLIIVHKQMRGQRTIIANDRKGVTIFTELTCL